MAGALYIHRYRMRMHSAGNARASDVLREGFLIKSGDGYGCVHPWPELGDPGADELLGMLREGNRHRLLERALACAEVDGRARREGRSLFMKGDKDRPSGGIPRSHATITDEADFPALRAAGFSVVKLKTHGGDAAIVRRVREAVEAGLRVRVDCNGTGISGLRGLREFGDRVEFIEDPEAYVPERWRAIREELGIPLALDRWEGEGEDGGGYEVRVLKPAVERCARRREAVVFTSYMDHPLGQMFAAWEAALYEGEQREAGLLTHVLYERDAFTEAVRAEGPQLLPAEGTGLGFDALLEGVEWERVPAFLSPLRGSDSSSTYSGGSASLHPRLISAGASGPEIDSTVGGGNHSCGPKAGEVGDIRPGLYLNPRVPLEDLPAELPEGCLVFATSGSTGAPALVCLKVEAMTANAAAVNEWVQATNEDVWLRVLPEFHVGGMSIHFRARLTGSRVVVDEGKWDARRFVMTVEMEKVTLTSLVPPQVFDLVEAGLRAPVTLRVVFVGGGRLEGKLYARARELGWPVLPGFGMTEAGSQVATARMDSLLENAGKEAPALELLPCWEGRVDEAGRLQIRGAPLAMGRMIREEGAWRLQRVADEDGWFTTSDRVRLEGRILTPLGRADRVVKVLGELVDLDAVEAAVLRAGMPPDRGVVLAIPDDRAGARPWLVTDLEDAEAVVAAANAELPPFARIAGWRCVPLPRSPLGKVLRGEVARTL